MKLANVLLVILALSGVSAFAKANPSAVSNAECSAMNRSNLTGNQEKDRLRVASITDQSSKTPDYSGNGTTTKR